MLDTERAFFETIRPHLMTTCPGQFVLIKDKDLIGTYRTIQDALAEGARMFDLQPFLVREVTNSQQEISIPALTLGILSADPTPSASGPA